MRNKKIPAMKLFHLFRLCILCYLICGLTSLTILFSKPASHTPADSARVVAMTRTAINLLRAGKFDESRLIVDSIHRFAIETGWQKKIGDCYFNYSQIELQRGYPDSFFVNAGKALDIYLNQKAWSDAARTHTSIAQVQVKLKNYPDAFKHFKESLELRESLYDTLGVTNNLINIGNLFYLEGRHADASEYFFQALRFADETGNKNLAAIALMNMGNVLIAQRNFEKAAEYLQKSLQYHRAVNNRKEEANVLHNLGIVFFELNDLSAAKEYYLQAKLIKEELSTDLSELVKIYNNLGLIAKREGNEGEALQFFYRVLDLSRQSADKQSEAAALNNLGSIKMDQQSPEALNMILQSLEIARTMGLRKLELSNYDNLRRYHTRTGNFEKAYEYSMSYQMLNDSIYFDESAEKIIELQTRYDTDMKEKENQLLLADNRIRKQSQQFFLTTTIVFILLSLSLFWAFILKRNSLLQNRQLLFKERELSDLKIRAIEAQNSHLHEMLFAEEEIKKLQAQALEQKKQELTSSAMLIANKNEAFERLRHLAEHIKANGSEGSETAREIVAEIDRQTDFGIQWEQFKMHFESIHKDFFRNLNEKNKCLTQTDLQLCTYVKLNLSTKEISRLINIAPESVFKNRYRLRKKLNLPPDETLEDFLHKL
jgi:tetratricopeptide (TPR) repeat protein